MPKIMSLSKKLTATRTPNGTTKKTASARPSGATLTRDRRSLPVPLLIARPVRIGRKIGAGPTRRPRPL